jgi:hypothetical protein
MNDGTRFAGPDVTWLVKEEFLSNIRAKLERLYNSKDEMSSARSAT